MSLDRAREWLRTSAGKSTAMLAIAVLAGLVIGYLLVPRAPTPSDPKAPAPQVMLLGQPLTLDDSAGKRALERVRRFAAGEFSLEVSDGKRRAYSLGRLGVEIDKVRLAQLVRDARDATSPLRQAFQKNQAQGPLVLPVPLALNLERALPALLVLKDELDRLPSDARLDLEKRRLVPEVYGQLLDVDATLFVIERALGAGERKASVVFERKKPRRVSADLGNVTFDEVLGYFKTPYNQSMRYAARTYNLRLAASKLDGTVLLPGEEFDFNEVVGPRDEANGYKVAPVIAEGEVVDGIGGGTCQISGTLHGAAFFAGLEIVERYPHTRPSSYIKMGLDATVVYPTINFRIKNPFTYPIVLHEIVKNGWVRAEILGPKRTQTVTLIRRITQAIPYEQVERPDKDLPRGVRKLSQRGVPGFKLHRYRILRDGRNAVRERWNDTYPPTTQIISVGTGDMPRDSVKVVDDPHPEYVADELFVLTQGLDQSNEDGERDDNDEKRGGSTIEQRDPGKYGKYGWTEEAGMPVWRGEQSKPEDDKADSKAKPKPGSKKH